MQPTDLNTPLRRPASIGWTLNPYKAPIPTRHEVWDHNVLGIRVISTVEYTSSDRGIELHLSVSRIGARYPDEWSLDKVRRDFNAKDFELDSHGSTIAHLWLPIERDKRGECDCKG